MSLRRAAPWIVLCGLFAVALVYVLTAGAETARPSAGTAPAPVPSSHGDGLTDAHDGYRLTPVELPAERGTARPVAFQIVGPDGTVAKGYQTVHTKPLHLYVVRDDLSLYQHVHPELTGDLWTATVDVPDGGAYRVYAEFTPRDRAGTGHPTVLGVPFVVTGDTTFVPVPAAAPSTTVDGYTVNRLDGTAELAPDKPNILRFQVLDAQGRPVPTLEPYLGAYAHMSAFEVLSQSLIHLHPAVSAGADPVPRDGVLTFHAQFPNRGEQRLFLQFQAAGKVHLAAFTVVVN